LWGNLRQAVLALRSGRQAGSGSLRTAMLPCEPTARILRPLQRSISVRARVALNPPAEFVRVVTAAPVRVVILTLS
jgi:hypothetical protein